MVFLKKLDSPLGKLYIVSDGEALTGLWIEGQKYFQATVKEEVAEIDLPLFERVEKWLEGYFEGKIPSIDFQLRPSGSEFRQMVWKELLEIPYGQTSTYGEIAKHVAAKLGRSSMSAQAVGGAVGHNPISIIIPCHRVLGSTGSLTGYAGGIEKKIWLLEKERKREEGVKIE